MNTHYLTREENEEYAPVQRRIAIRTLTAPPAARDSEGIPLNANRNSRKLGRRRRQTSSNSRESKTPTSSTGQEAAPRSHYHDTSGSPPISSAENPEALRGSYGDLRVRDQIDSSVIVGEEYLSRNKRIDGLTPVQTNHPPNPQRRGGNQPTRMMAPNPTSQRTDQYARHQRRNEISSRTLSPEQKGQLRVANIRPLRSRLSTPFSLPEYTEEESPPVSPISIPIRRQVSILSDVSETNEHWDAVLNGGSRRRRDGQLENTASRLDNRIDETMWYWERM